jgi:hypothetical protein
MDPGLVGGDATTSTARVMHCADYRILSRTIEFVC